MWPSKTVELSAPSLLVATPQLHGSPFAQTVVLLAQHGEQGSMGLVINRPSGTSFGTFCRGLGVKPKGRQDDDVFVGGPVEPERAFILHSAEHRGPETQEVLAPLCMSYSMETLALVAEAPPADLRICVGYAGWGQGQLAIEVGRGGWMVMGCDARFVFDAPPAGMWHAALQKMGIQPMQLMHSTTVH